MAEDASKVREAIDQTRNEIGETIQAIGEKVDVKARAGRGRPGGRWGRARRSFKLGDVAQGVGDRLSNAAAPVVSAAAEWAQSATHLSTGSGRRQRLAICLGLTAAVVIILARRFRHNQGQR